MTAKHLYLLAFVTLPLAAQSLDPDASLKIDYHFLAVGKQIYKCDNGAWSKSATSDATLYDMNSNLKVRHGAGPSWTKVDGSSTMKAIASTAVHRVAPQMETRSTG